MDLLISCQEAYMDKFHIDNILYPKTNGAADPAVQKET